MLVGETRAIAFTETSQTAFTPTSPSCVITSSYPGEAAQVPSVSVTPGTAATAQTFSALFTGNHAGKYRVAWSFALNGQLVERLDNYMVYYTDVPGLVRLRLRMAASDVPDSLIDPTFNSISRSLFDRFTSLSTLDGYYALTGLDQERYDEAVALLVAAKLSYSLPKRTPAGDITQIKMGAQVEYSFAPSPGRALSAADDWIQEACTYLGRVSVIQTQLAKSASAFQIFTVTGPTRDRSNRNIPETLYNLAAQSLVDDKESFMDWGN